MERAGTGNTAGKDLSPLCHALSEPCGILVVYSLHLVSTEDANLFAAPLLTSGRSLLSFHYKPPMMVTHTNVGGRSAADDLPMFPPVYAVIPHDSAFLTLSEGEIGVADDALEIRERVKGDALTCRVAVVLCRSLIL